MSPCVPAPPPLTTEFNECLSFNHRACGNAICRRANRGKKIQVEQRGWNIESNRVEARVLERSRDPLSVTEILPLRSYRHALTNSRDEPASCLLPPARDYETARVPSNVTWIVAYRVA